MRSFCSPSTSCFLKRANLSTNSSLLAGLRSFATKNSPGEGGRRLEPSKPSKNENWEERLEQKIEYFADTPRDLTGWRNPKTRDIFSDQEIEEESRLSQRRLEHARYKPENDFLEIEGVSTEWGKEHIKTDQMVVNELIHMGTNTKPTKGGKQMSFSALVLVGNGKGSAGLGYGKAMTGIAAIQAATIDAEKRLIHIKRYKGTSNVSRVKLKNRGCYVTKTPFTGDVGVKGCPMVQLMADAFGIGSLSLKIVGPSTKNIASRAKTVFEALVRNRDPDSEAKAMGKMLFSTNKIWRRKDFERVY